MKKLIEIDDELYGQIVTIQKENHIRTTAPVISLLMSLGVKTFNKSLDWTNLSGVCSDE